jgi:hypothetical protein
MPEWGKLLQERADLNLVVIDADLIPNQAEDASAMLAKTGLAAAENWIFNDPFMERLRFEIDPRWQGEIQEQCSSRRMAKPRSSKASRTWRRCACGLMRKR